MSEERDIPFREGHSNVLIYSITVGVIISIALVLAAIYRGEDTRDIATKAEVAALSRRVDDKPDSTTVRFVCNTLEENWKQLRRNVLVVVGTRRPTETEAEYQARRAGTLRLFKGLTTDNVCRHL